MNLKKLLTVALAGALFVGTVATSSAAELDLAWYAAKNPDVVAAFGNSPEMLKLHYDMFGRKEARMANSHDTEAQLRKMFNPTEYATLYPDVKAALGENAEAMFQHYMAFGLLESRRPSEKVSKETAATLKKAVEKALATAGIPALPGSAQLVAVLTGEIKADVVGGAAVQQALAQVASVVEKAVVETVQKVNNPSSGGGGGSSSSSTPTSKAPETSKAAKLAIWATLRHNSQEDTDEIGSVSTNDVLDALNDADNLSINQEGDVIVVTVKNNVTIPKHKNPEDTASYWCGIGVPYVSGNDPTDAASEPQFTYYIGTATTKETAKYSASNPSPAESDKDNRQDYMPVDGQNYATFYWGTGWAECEAEETPEDGEYQFGWLIVADKSGEDEIVVARYVIDFRNITFKIYPPTQSDGVE